MIHISKDGKMLCNRLDGGLYLTVDINESYIVSEDEICRSCLWKRKSYPEPESKIITRIAEFVTEPIQKSNNYYKEYITSNGELKWLK